jgi:ABC-type transport system involved in multi-copper enzyme maturation permease subunit
MRPYIAVIKDSFREALASRVLWILLVVTTLVLLAIAPATIKEQLATTLRRGDIDDWSALVAELRGPGPATSPKKRVWSALPDTLRSQLRALAETKGNIEVPFDVQSETVESLNKMLTQRNLYDAQVWKAEDLTQEAADLVARGVARLPAESLARLNRLLLETAFPLEIAASSDAKMHLGYFHWTVDTPLPFPKGQMQTLIQSVLATFMSLFVGTIGVFVAILVTASIIPQTFDAGAIDLLLSKPVNRALLFLAKFAGGCAFILLNAAYLVGGLWLIAGLRFHLWSGRLLLCIPIFLFLFAIYYSVSSLAGVRWKSAIVSVVVTMLFWAACFLVGTTKNVIEQILLNTNRVVTLVPAGQSLFGVTALGRVVAWHQGADDWEASFEGETPDPSAGPFIPGPPMVGPVYDARNDRVLAVRSSGPRFPGMRLSTGSMHVAQRSTGWKRVEGPAAPASSSALFVDPRGDAIVLAREGIFRLQGDPQSKSPQVTLFGLNLPVPRAGAFSQIGPERVTHLTGHAFSAGMNAETGELAIWSRGVLSVLRRDAAGRYVRQAESELADPDMAALIAFGGRRVLVAQADGRVRVLNAGDLRVEHESSPAGNEQPAATAAAPGGHWFLVRFHNGRLWLFDSNRNQLTRRGIAGQGDISAAAFAGKTQLLVVDRGRRVTQYQLDPSRVEHRLAPPLGVLERIYRYGILPFYTVFPKPGELDNMVQYVLTRKETVSQAPAQDLATPHVKLNVWAPVWSSLAFLVVMLAATCWHVSRADF